MGMFRNPSTPISKLNLSNFEEFATDYAQYAFELAYKCIPKVENATALAISALSRTVCVEAAEPGSDQIGAEAGIQRAMKFFLTKPQRERLVSDAIRTDSNIFTFEIGEKIIDGSVIKAKKDMPRYAPVFSGISGTMLILTLVALIIAAIVFIWINPLKGRLIEEKGVSGSDVIYSTPAARLNSQLMLDVESEVSCTDARGNRFNSGLPVKLSVTGIDADDALSISVRGDNGTDYPIYQLDAGSYCFVADSNQIYNVRISNTGGASVSHYVSVYQLEKDFDRTRAVPFCARKSSGDSEAAPFEGKQGIQAISAAVGSGGGVPVPGSVSVTRVPSACSVMVSQDKRTLTFTGKGYTGIDSMDITVTDAENRNVRYTVPVIIADNVPIISQASREISIRHTPSKAGTYAGRLSAVDADGDSVQYALADTVNCSVMMSPSGAYIVRAAEEFGGAEASFSVTASDGCITSSPVDIRVKLNNGLVTADNYKYNVVCMSQGAYKLDLPPVDDDGDPITWSISSPENGQTDNAYVSIDNGKLVYRMFENVNREYTDTVRLFCSDGWTTATPIPFDRVCKRNQPPTQSGTNRYTMNRTDGSIQINVELSNDNPEDVCVIDELLSCTGGDVRQDDNWRNLIFTFVPDGSEDICSVRLRVRENSGDNTAVVEYYIIIE